MTNVFVPVARSLFSVALNPFSHSRAVTGRSLMRGLSTAPADSPSITREGRSAAIRSSASSCHASQEASLAWPSELISRAATWQLAFSSVTNCQCLSSAIEFAAGNHCPA